MIKPLENNKAEARNEEIRKEQEAKEQEAKEQEEKERKEKERETKRQEIKEWDVDAVLEWLEQNQLSKFADSFTEQSIDGPALLGLEEKYFASLGVSKIGDKIKLENALKSIQ